MNFDVNFVKSQHHRYFLLFFFVLSLLFKGLKNLLQPHIVSKMHLVVMVFCI